MVVDTESIRTVFGIIGNIISVALFASAVPTFYRTIKTNSVEELKPEYNLATTMSYLFWVFYDVRRTESVEGMPFLNVLISTLFRLCWFIYACLKIDFFLLVVNLNTSLWGIYLLILYGVYYKSTPKSGADRNLATTKVWDERTGKWTDKKLATAQQQLP